MNIVNVSNQAKGSFERAVAEARKGDVIIYHVGLTCQKAKHRRIAMGAYEVGLVLLVKIRLSPDGMFSHRAIRTKKHYHSFHEARDEN